MLSFRQFLETLKLDSREVTIPKGTILYHGTIESYDTRKIRGGGYDNVFWTAEDLIIARSYIPVKGSYMNTNIASLLRDEDHEGIRKSLGITSKVKAAAFKKQDEHYKKLIHWEEKHKEFKKRSDELHRSNKFDDFTDEFFAQWRVAEDNYKQAQKNMKWYDNYLKDFVKYKMKAFGYTPTSVNSDYYTKIYTDKDGSLLPAQHSDMGKVLKVICNRDFRMYSMAHGNEGDLMDLDYKKLDVFHKLEEKGYDGVVINDFAQTSYHGNYGHRSIGFFNNALKDISVKQIRNQTHPKDNEW